ncbi:hypothetical protein BDP81DRAFT_417001, partial [Colletotrichum phormii]
MAYFSSRPITTTLLRSRLCPCLVGASDVVAHGASQYFVCYYFFFTSLFLQSVLAGLGRVGFF